MHAPRTGVGEGGRAGVPSQLVVSLLSLDPQARPASAAEVMDRLATLAQLPPLAELEVAQAYLTTPQLVGRERERNAWRKALERSDRSAVWVVSGRSGTGRSRLLASLSLDGKLAGRAVLRLDASTLSRQPFAGVHKLAAELSELPGAADALTPALRVSLAPRAGSSSSAPPGIAQGRAQSDALLASLMGLLKRRPVLIVVDDVDRVDDPSSALLLELAQRGQQAPLMLVVSCDAEQGEPSTRALVAAFASHGRTLSLGGLDEAGTGSLLRSVFGDASNIKGVAAWAQQVGEGLPKATMELAQHLVDAGIARFELGRWTLPEDLSALSMPDSIEKVLHARVAGLGPAASEIGQLLAILIPIALDPPGILAYPELFAERLSSRALFGGLDELVSAGMLVLKADHYAFASEAHREALEQALGADDRRALHARAAAYYMKRDDELERLATYHLWHAGERTRAFELLATPLPAELPLDSPRVRLARRPQGLALYHWAIDHIETAGPPRSAQTFVYGAALKLAAVADPTLSRCAERALQILVHDSGRDPRRRRRCPTASDCGRCLRPRGRVTSTASPRSVALHRARRSGSWPWRWPP